MNKLLVSLVNTSNGARVDYFDVATDAESSFRDLQHRLAARCTGPMYRDTPDGSTPIGWVFERRTNWDGKSGTFLQQVWVEVVHDSRLAPSGMPLAGLCDLDVSKATGKLSDILHSLSHMLYLLDPEQALYLKGVWGDEGDDESFAMNEHGVISDDESDWTSGKMEIAYSALDSYVRHLAEDRYTPRGFCFGTHTGDSSRIGWYPEELYRDEFDEQTDGIIYPIDYTQVYRRSTRA
jgi:hypothetical protein